MRKAVEGTAGLARLNEEDQTFTVESEDIVRARVINGLKVK